MQIQKLHFCCASFSKSDQRRSSKLTKCIRKWTNGILSVFWKLLGCRQLQVFWVDCSRLKGWRMRNFVCRTWEQCVVQCVVRHNVWWQNENVVVNIADRHRQWLGGERLNYALCKLDAWEYTICRLYGRPVWQETNEVVVKIGLHDDPEIGDVIVNK